MASRIRLRMIKMRFALIFALIVLTCVSFAYAQGFQSPTVCCEKTVSGIFCQDVPEVECAADAKKVSTSCEATTYCKPGICFDSSEGTCLDHTPQNVCNQNGGIWTDKPAPQCQLGCCVLGDQAAFVTQTRCKRLSSFLGLETNFRNDLKTEVSCIASVLGQEKGACVFESEFQKTCRLTTRAECAGGVYGNRTKGDFYVGKLCSAEELGTNCGLTTKTACVPGKEEVYFVDTCGNIANIYDASKVNDKEYWSNIKSKEDSCKLSVIGSIIGGSASCGNCNYIEGSFCRATTKGGQKATYGDNICSDMNCKNTVNGRNYKHGESWCVNEENNVVGSPGSRFFKHICINGEEVLEACADYRQQVCIEDSITYSGGTFSQAACRVNRWQECTSQTSQSDCENIDLRDCVWQGTNLQRCVPKVAPGLKFWEGTEARAICTQMNQQCNVVAEKPLYDTWKITEGRYCADVDSGGHITVKELWKNDLEAGCRAVGDCGIDVNWLGEGGAYEEAFNFTRIEED